METILNFKLPLCHRNDLTLTLVFSKVNLITPMRIVVPAAFCSYSKLFPPGWRRSLLAGEASSLQVHLPPTYLLYLKGNARQQLLVGRPTLPPYCRHDPGICSQRPGDNSSRHESLGKFVNAPKFKFFSDCGRYILLATFSFDFLSYNIGSKVNYDI